MGFAGLTYQVPFTKGGFTYDRNIDQLDGTAMLPLSRNINLHQNGRGRRGGTSKVNTVAISGSPQILSGFDFRLATSSFQVFTTADGKLYKDSTTTLKTGLSAVNRTSFAVFDGKLYATDGSITPQIWDGSAGATSDITTPADDWTTTKPTQFLAHGVNASRRLWAIAGKTLYYSVGNNGQDFKSAGSGQIVIAVQDAYGLVAMVEYGQRLIVFSKTEAFIIEDTDAATANWGYTKAQWFGGAAHWRGVCAIENDVAVLAEDGQLYSVTAVLSYGDYKIASLMRPSFIDIWFKENADMTRIADFHLTFDRNLRALKLFFVRNGQTKVDTALVYFLDRGPQQGWMIHNNDTPAGYSASCSFEVRTSIGTYVTYTGDYMGFLWKLEQATRADNGAAYYSGFQMPSMTFGDPRLRKHYRQLRLIFEDLTAASMSVKVYVDNVYQTTLAVPIQASGGVLGSFILDTDTLGDAAFTEGQADLNYVGKRIQLEIFNQTEYQDFFISQVLFDFKPMKALI